MYRWYDCINGEWIDGADMNREDALKSMTQALIEEDNDPEHTGLHAHSQDHYLANPEDDEGIDLITSADVGHNCERMPKFAQY